jgi:hypothetical protein
MKIFQSTPKNIRVKTKIMVKTRKYPLNERG